MSPLPQLALSVALLLPLLLTGGWLVRGFQPWPLVAALLVRFRWTNAIYVLLIAVSVGMGIALIAQERALRVGSSKAAEKFDLIVGAPGSELTLTMAAVYLQPARIPLLDGETFAAIADNPRVTMAAPIAFGDSYEGVPIVGSIPEFVMHLSDGNLEGRNFALHGEAVAGAHSGLEIGDHFEPHHGHGALADQTAHEGTEIEVVGKLPVTGSPWDRAILIPVETVWETHGLANGHPIEAGPRIGPPFEPSLFPGTPAIVVSTRDAGSAYGLKTALGRDGTVMGVFPGAVLANLYRIMGDARKAMSVLTLVSQILVAASVLLGLFILSRLFQRQMTVLRAIGAPRRFVVAVVWGYGASLLMTGTLLGLGLGYIAAALLSRFVSARTDILISVSIGWSEIQLALTFLSLASVLSLLPAVLVLLRPIAASLRS